MCFTSKLALHLKFGLSKQSKQCQFKDLQVEYLSENRGCHFQSQLGKMNDRDSGEAKNALKLIMLICARKV